MKKFLIVFSILFSLSTSLVQAYTERNSISSVSSNGEIIRMIDGSVYKIYDYDAMVSEFWTPYTDVIITEWKIINVDDDESVEYEYQIR